MVRGLTPTRNQTTKFGTTLLVVASLVFAIIIETTDAFLAPSSRVFSCYYCGGQSYLPPPSLVRMTSDDIPESSNNVNMESVWRFIKKPLLRLGSKGISPSHGNSLRELLKSHRVIKVKVNNRKDGTSVHARWRNSKQYSLFLFLILINVLHGIPFFLLHQNEKILVTLEESFENLKRLAEASGTIEGIELLRTRPSENVFMCGVKGSLQLIEKGEYPSTLAEP